MKGLAGSVGSLASQVNIISNAASPTGDGPDELAFAEFSLWHRESWLCVFCNGGQTLLHLPRSPQRVPMQAGQMQIRNILNAKVVGRQHGRLILDRDATYEPKRTGAQRA